MIVDTLLRMVGDDPDAYVRDSDKWISIENAILIVYVFPYLPWVLALLPWMYFLIKRKKHTKDIKKFAWKVAKYSIGGLMLGFIIPWLFVALLAGLAANSLYGGTI